MNVSLPPELERFVEDQVGTGRYRTASDVVRAALSILAERQQMIVEINEMIDESEADIAAGRTYGEGEAREILRAHRQAMSAAKTP